MPRDYPLFLFDRNRRSRSEQHQFDYTVCLDRTYGFVARVLLLNRQAYNALLAQPLDELSQYHYLLKSGKAGLVMVVEDFLYGFEPTAEARTRIRSLLKKAMNKYLFAEVSMAPSDTSLSIDNQLLVLLDISKDLKAGYDKMAAHMGEKHADHYIACVDAAIVSLRTLSKISV